jgi:putative transposase
MPRSARIDTPGILHHVIIRGIEKKFIFRDETDKENFVERLSRLIPETQTSCYAWALLDNHAHFLFRSGPSGLSSLMRRLLTGYVVTFNHRHKRHGQLFQNRYKSIICQEEPYLLDLVRYIHLNPLRSRMVADLNTLSEYSFSGHRFLMGMGTCTWQDDGYVLSLFGSHGSTERRRYFEFVKKGIPAGRRPDLVGGGLIRSIGGWSEVKALRKEGMDRIKGDERILGDSEFMLSVLSEANEKIERRYALKRLGYDIPFVAKTVAGIYQIKPSEIYKKGRRRPRSDARALFCYWCTNALGTTLTELARKLEMTVSGVGYAVRRGERIANENGFTL